MIVWYGSITHLLAFHADVCRASIVLRPSTERATATRSAEELRNRTSYSEPRKASTYVRPRLRYSLSGRPSTRTWTSNVGYGIRLVMRSDEESRAVVIAVGTRKTSVVTATRSEERRVGKE